MVNFWVLKGQLWVLTYVSAAQFSAVSVQSRMTISHVQKFPRTLFNYIMSYPCVHKRKHLKIQKILLPALILRMDFLNQSAKSKQCNIFRSDPTQPILTQVTVDLLSSGNSNVDQLKEVLRGAIVRKGVNGFTFKDEFPQGWWKVVLGDVEVIF